MKNSKRENRVTKGCRATFEKIMDTPFGEAINDKELYCSIIENRSIFNRIEGVDYALHAPTTLSFIPPANVIPDWEKDYISMPRNFIYDKNSLTFSRLLDRMSELTLRIRQLGDMVKKMNIYGTIATILCHKI